MDQVQQRTEDLLLAIEGSEEYTRYQKVRKKIVQYPVLKEKADEFRRQNYEFQSGGTGHFEEGDKLRLKYANVMEHPIVREYLAAENEICRMLRKINWRILGQLDLELDMEEK